MSMDNDVVTTSRSLPFCSHREVVIYKSLLKVDSTRPEPTSTYPSEYTGGSRHPVVQWRTTRTYRSDYIDSQSTHDLPGHIGVVPTDLDSRVSGRSSDRDRITIPTQVPCSAYTLTPS